MYSLFASQDAYNKDQSICSSSHQEWSHNRIVAFELAILGHVVFLRNLEGIDSGLLAFWEQIENGHTFVLALFADTFKAFNIGRTTDHHTWSATSRSYKFGFSDTLEHAVTCN